MSLVAQTVLTSAIPVPWCEEFEKMINGKQFVRSQASATCFSRVKVRMLTETHGFQLLDIEFRKAHGIQALHSSQIEPVQ